MTPEDRLSGSAWRSVDYVGRLDVGTDGCGTRTWLDRAMIGGNPRLHSVEVSVTDDKDEVFRPEG